MARVVYSSSTRDVTEFGNAVELLKFLPGIWIECSELPPVQFLRSVNRELSRRAAVRNANNNVRRGNVNENKEPTKEVRSEII